MVAKATTCVRCSCAQWSCLSWIVGDPHGDPGSHGLSFALRPPVATSHVSNVYINEACVSLPLGARS